jgi:hypothetical protein
MFTDNFDDYIFDAQYRLLPRELENIDKDVRRVIYRNSVAPKIFGTKQIPKGRTSHKVAVAKQPSDPVFSMDFLPEAMDKVDKEYSTFYLVGISKDYFLSMVDIDASRNSEYSNTKVDTLHLREMTAMVADYREKVLWRGQDVHTSSRENKSIVKDLVGIINTSGINTFVANGTAAKLGTAGDGSKGAADAFSELVVDKYDPPYDTVMTPHVVAQLAKNFNSTTHITDLERIRGMTDEGGQKLIRNIHISDHLLNAADDGSASAWAFIAPKAKTGEDTVQILESYPLWHYPITSNKLGIQGKVLTMVGAAVIRPKAICFEDSIDVDGT